jgi:starvation-inducible outer membrane lipoprotein
MILMEKIWLGVLMLAIVNGCAPAAISPSLQQQAGAPVSFAVLSAHPEQYQGRLVILGGEVMSVQPLGDGSLLTLSQRDLDKLYEYKPVPSGGTFLVESDQWLNPNTYQPKSTVKVAGEVKGRRNGLLVLKAREVAFIAPPVWEKWYYPVPPEWYDYDPNLEYWFTPPYFDPYRGGGSRGR